MSIDPGLYAVCDDTVRPDLPLGEQARLLLLGGVRTLQVRIKRTGTREAVLALKGIAAQCRAAGARCLVNDRVDWALVCGADGAHVGEEDLKPQDARALLGPTRLLGVTARSLDAVRRALEEGADHVGVGPVFETRTKDVNAPALGTAGLGAVVRGSPLPVVAISGIRLTNIASVAGTCVHAAAVISDLLTAPDIPARARALAAQFQMGRQTA